MRRTQKTKKTKEKKCTFENLRWLRDFMRGQIHCWRNAVCTPHNHSPCTASVKKKKQTSDTKENIKYVNKEKKRGKNKKLPPLRNEKKNGKNAKTSTYTLLPSFLSLPLWAVWLSAHVTGAQNGSTEMQAADQNEVLLIIEQTIVGREEWKERWRGVKRVLATYRFDTAGAFWRKAAAERDAKGIKNK